MGVGNRSIPGKEAPTVRYSNSGSIREQVGFLRRQFLQDGDLPFTDVLTEDVITPPIAQLELRGIRPVVGVEQGQASWYTCPNPGLFAANLSLPFGTQVTVTNLDNGKSVTVVINDRGPYGVAGRIIDLCSTAFEEIAPLGQGVANVEISW